MMKTSHFYATLDQLHPMLQWIQEQIQHHGLDPALLSKIELASEEALVNIIRHAYRNEGGEIEIEIELIPQKHLKISFLDKGFPFNPLELPPSRKKEEIGGLGIVLMRKCVDDLFYQRDHERNILSLLVLFHR
jgi:serine/threonine-protein kinase RsbW